MNETHIAEIRALADGPRYMRDATPLLAALTELLGEVERLERERDHHDKKRTQNLVDGIGQYNRAEAAESKLAKAVEALKFYGAKNAWQYVEDASGLLRNLIPSTALKNDRGQLARMAISEIEES